MNVVGCSTLDRILHTCKTLMGELESSKPLRDRIQNHALNDVSSKHYGRYEYLPEKRRALGAWECKLNQELISNVLVSVGVNSE